MLLYVCPLAFGEFHKYRLKWNSFQILAITCVTNKRRTKRTDLSSFITDFTTEKAPTSSVSHGVIDVLAYQNASQRYMWWINLWNSDILLHERRNMWLNATWAYVSACMEYSFCKRISSIYRIWNEFSFHTVLMKRVVCFYIAEPLAREYKTHNEFHKYRMKWKFISDSFYHLLNSQERKKNTVSSSFITDFTAENAPTSGRYIWRHRRTATSQPIKMFPCAMS